MPRKKATEPKEETKTAKAAVASAINKKPGFDLEKYKKTKNLGQQAKFKKQEWIPMSDAMNKILGLPGLPKGHISLIRGKSDTGKTTAFNEALISAQNLGDLVVIIITEMKFSFEHLIDMGFKAERNIDEETGEITYSGDFIYIDRGSLGTIEDVAAFIFDLMDEQSKGQLPRDLFFAWDSVGSLPSKQSVDSGKNNPMWNAGAMSMQFGNFINQRIPLSRKVESKYTNSMFVVQKVGVDYQIGVHGAQPRRTNAHGDAMYWDATIAITVGNVTNAGTSKIQAVKDKKNVTFAKRTKICVDKNHITDATTEGKIIMTTYGFIEDTPSSIEKYKKAHRHEWINELGEGEIETVEEGDIQENDQSYE